MLTIELNMYHAVALGAFLFWLGSVITPPPRKFCSGIITMEMARHRMTALPPLSSAGILTVKPTVVKNMIIKTACSVASKGMDAMPME